ncbi:MAG: type II CAAX endopeptidase family protein [Armatimonadota bacterium]
MQNDIQEIRHSSVRNALNLFLIMLILGGVLYSINKNLFGFKYFSDVINNIFLILILLIAAKKQKLNIINAFSIKKINYRIVILSILIGVISFFTGTYLYYLIKSFCASVVIIADPYPKSNNNLDSYLFIFLMVIIAPLYEEFYFRGYLLNAFKKFGFIQAIVIASFLFGALHMNCISHIISSIFVSLVLGYLVYRTGSIFSSMLAHGTFNATAILFAYFYTYKFSAYTKYHLPPVLIILSIILIILLFKLLIKETPNAEVDTVRFKGFWGNIKSLFGLWQFWSIMLLFLFILLSSFIKH